MNSQRSFFSKRVSSDQSKQSKLPRQSNIELFQRPISALAKHHIHELSDIREVSGSSKGATVNKKASSLLDGTEDLPRTPEGKGDDVTDSTSSEYTTPVAKSQGGKMGSMGLGSRATSAMSLPLRDVPERRSSASIFAPNRRQSSKASFQGLPKWQMPPEAPRSKSVSLRGRSDSPVRQALNKSTQSSEAMRLSPFRTFIRTTPPLDILEKGSLRSDHLEVSVHLPSPLFVGGGTIEGHIKLKVHEDTKKSKMKPMSISRLSLDVIGVEEVNDGRRWIFLSLGSELFDETHPPPPALVNSEAIRHESELSWALKPASAVVPFCVNLPLNLGPPPYLSRQASIRYILSPTAHFKVGETEGSRSTDMERTDAYCPRSTESISKPTESTAGRRLTHNVTHGSDTDCTAHGRVAPPDLGQWKQCLCRCPCSQWHTENNQKDRGAVGEDDLVLFSCCCRYGRAKRHPPATPKTKGHRACQHILDSKVKGLERCIGTHL